MAPLSIVDDRTRYKPDMKTAQSSAIFATIAQLSKLGDIAVRRWDSEWYAED